MHTDASIRVYWVRYLYVYMCPKGETTVLPSPRFYALQEMESNRILKHPSLHLQTLSRPTSKPFLLDISLQFLKIAMNSSKTSKTFPENQVHNSFYYKRFF